MKDFFIVDLNRNDNLILTIYKICNLKKVEFNIKIKNKDCLTFFIFLFEIQVKNKEAIINI